MAIAKAVDGLGRANEPATAALTAGAPAGAPVGAPSAVAAPNAGATGVAAPLAARTAASLIMLFCLVYATSVSALDNSQHICRRTALGIAGTTSLVCSPSVSSAISARLSSPRLATVRSVPFVLIGVGGVGSALLKEIASARSFHAGKYGIRFSALAVCDSSAAVLAANANSELSDETLTALTAHKATGASLATLRGPSLRNRDGMPADEFLRILVEEYAADAPDAVVVDCSASAATIPALLLAARRLRVVSANKKPFADSSITTFASLARTPSSPARVRYESTVGAGLPVVATLSRLVGAHDRVHRISGCLSGSLGYITSALQAGEAFSSVVGRAKRLGYTEPDPRDDLGGVDVARKALILARTLGMDADLADVDVQPLCPPQLARLPLIEFMAALPSLDESFASRAAAAAADGDVLRYVATVTPPTSARASRGRLTVGLASVPAASPLGSLSGTDNLVEMGTDVYATTSLVLRGAGAGTAATASGVLADMVELAFMCVRTAAPPCR